MSEVAPSTNEPGLERERWQAELRLKERELSLQEEELRFKQREEQRSKWSNPLVLAVLAAALAAAGNAAVAYINGAAQRELEQARGEGQKTVEETRAEAARILEVIKVDPKLALRNLSFLTEVGLIQNSARRNAITEYVKKTSPSEGPSLPQFKSKDDLMKELAAIDTNGDPADVMKKMTTIQLQIQDVDRRLQSSNLINGDGRLKGTWAQNLSEGTATPREGSEFPWWSGTSGKKGSSP
jgi:hypothetical protein